MKYENLVLREMLNTEIVNSSAERAFLVFEEKMVKLSSDGLCKNLKQ